jgi:hypothetical protein
MRRSSPTVERYNKHGPGCGGVACRPRQRHGGLSGRALRGVAGQRPGQAYEAWLDAYRSVDLETVDIEAPEPVEIPEHGPQDDVLDLPECPEA